MTRIGRKVYLILLTQEVVVYFGVTSRRPLNDVDLNKLRDGETREERERDRRPPFYLYYED